MNIDEINYLPAQYQQIQGLEVDKGGNAISKPMVKPGVQLTPLPVIGYAQLHGVPMVTRTIRMPDGEDINILAPKKGFLLPVVTTRQGYLINSVLPYVVGGPDFIAENYAGPFAQTRTLPAGITCQVAPFNDIALRFAFQQGLNVDNIDLTTNFPVSYVAIMEMIKNDWLVARGWQQVVGTGNSAAQFNSGPFSWGRGSLSGFTGGSGNPFSFYIDPLYQQGNVASVTKKVRLNSRRYIVMVMAAAIVNPGDNIVNNNFVVDDWDSTSDFEGETVTELD